VQSTKNERAFVVQSAEGGGGDERATFWKAYRACVEANGVRPDRSPFYVKRAQTFARFLPQKRLRDRSGTDIQAFLAHLRQRQSIAATGSDHATRLIFIHSRPRSRCLLTFDSYFHAPACPCKRHARSGVGSLRYHQSRHPVSP
jgi:hypothetical protein